LGRGSKDSWLYEGVQCKLYPSKVPGTIPLYRWWNGLDHFYTSERRSFNNLGFKSEGVAGYCYPRDRGSQTIPLYRWYYHGTCYNHFYTTSYSEGKGSGYKYEGIVCYVLKA